MERMNEKDYKALKLSDSAKKTMCAIGKVYCIDNKICDYLHLVRNGGHQGALLKLISSGLIEPMYLSRKGENVPATDMPDSERELSTKNWVVTEKGKTALRVMSPVFAEVV